MHGEVAGEDGVEDTIAFRRIAHLGDALTWRRSFVGDPVSSVALGDAGRGEWPDAAANDANASRQGPTREINVRLRGPWSRCRRLCSSGCRPAGSRCCPMRSSG